MSAFLTIEPVSVALLRFQQDHLGYTRCPACVNESKGGRVLEILPQDLACYGNPIPCDVCGAAPETWPTFVKTCHATVEHVACKIY